MTQDNNIPTMKWKVINMDFTTGLPRTRRQHDPIWVIVDKFTKYHDFWLSRLYIPWRTTP